MFFPVIIILELLYECYKYYFISWDTNVSKVFDCKQINAVESCFFFAHLHNSNTDKRMWIWFVDDRWLLFSCLQMEKIKLFVILSFCVYLNHNGSGVVGNCGVWSWPTQTIIRVLLKRGTESRMENGKKKIQNNTRIQYVLV